MATLTITFPDTPAVRSCLRNLAIFSDDSADRMRDAGRTDRVEAYHAIDHAIDECLRSAPTPGGGVRA